MEARLTTFSQVESNILAADQAQASSPVQTAPTASEAQPAVTEQAPEATANEQTQTQLETQATETVVDNDGSSSDFNLDIPGVENVAAAPATVAAETPAFNLDEELKKLDRKEILKKLAVNDFSIEMDDYIAKGGKPSDYLSARSIDFNQVSDEELIKNEYRTQFPHFTKEEVNRLFNKKYGTTEDMSEDEVADRLLELKADGHVKRQARIQEQQQFKIPEAVTPQVNDEAYEQWKQAQESQSKLIEQTRNFFENHEATKSLNESKKVAVSLGEGVPPFNFNVDRPEIINRALTDNGEIWSRLTYTQSGEPDVKKQQLLLLFAANPDKFMRDIFSYGMNFGVRQKVVGEGQNAQRPQTKVLPLEANQKPTYGVGRFADRNR